VRSQRTDQRRAASEARPAGGGKLGPSGRAQRIPAATRGAVPVARLGCCLLASLRVPIPTDMCSRDPVRGAAARTADPTCTFCAGPGPRGLLSARACCARGAGRGGAPSFRFRLAAPLACVRARGHAAREPGGTRPVVGEQCGQLFSVWFAAPFLFLS
jgi:hypothetical protein